MIDFAIFSCGRSGSTWTAAWLSKYASVLHDPAARYTYEEIQAWGEETEGFTGISCTAGWLYGWADRLRKDGVPVVKLYREASGDGGRMKINRSFERVGLPPIPIHIYARFLELDASWHAFSKVGGNPPRRRVRFRPLGRVQPHEHPADRRGHQRGAGDGRRTRRSQPMTRLANGNRSMSATTRSCRLDTRRTPRVNSTSATGPKRASGGADGSTRRVATSGPVLGFTYTNHPQALETSE